MKFFNFEFFNRSKPDPIRGVPLNGRLSGGTFVDDMSAMTAAAYYRGVIYLSSQLAKLPMQIKDENNKVIKNDLHYLLNVQPNPETTAYHLKLFLLQCAINTGEGYAEIERTLDGRVRNLWPINPKKVSPIRDADGNLWYQIMSGGTNGDTIYLRPSEILIIRNIHTIDGFQGMGTIAFAANALGISLGADKFANSLYANGALPSAILSHPGKLSEAASKRLAESWKNLTGGKKTGSTAVLEEGVQYSAVSHSPDVLQFIETRKFGVIEIARFLGVPPIKLFDMDSAKYGNMEQVQLEVATDILDAWAKNIESEIDVKLLNGQRGGRKCELDLYAIFRGDMSTRSTYFTKMMQSSAMTANEIRVKEGMAPYKGGDRFYIASNNFSPVDRLDELVDSQIKSKEPAPAATPEKDDKEDDTLNKALAKYIETKLN